MPGEERAPRGGRRTAALALGAALLAGAWAATPAPANHAEAAPPACKALTPLTVRATTTQTVASHGPNGVPLQTTLTLPVGASATTPVPAVMATHGGGGARAELSSRTNLLFERLLSAGYAVLTWNTRGHGSGADRSGGAWSFGARDHEGRDASDLIGWLARCGAIAREAPDDPLLGMVGFSNGGGVQLNLTDASGRFDRRVDALVPGQSWGDLPDDLAPNGVATAWNDLIHDGFVAAGVPFAPELDDWNADVRTTGSLSPATRAWLAERSTTPRAPAVEAPTLLLQGTVDTLFSLEGALRRYELIRGRAGARVPVKLVAFCRGHGGANGCPYASGDVGVPTPMNGRPHWENRVVEWLDRHVRGLPIDTGPELEWQSPDGAYRSAPGYPLPGTEHVERTADGPIGTLAGPGGSGGDGRLQAGIAATSYPDARTPDPPGSFAQVPVGEPAASCRAIVGLPRLRVAGSVVEGETAHLFAQLYEAAPRQLARPIDVQARAVRLPAGDFDVSLELDGVAWQLRQGMYVVLELTTGSDMYDEGPVSAPFRVRVDRAAVTLPEAPC